MDMKRNRFTSLVIFLASLFSLKNVNCDSELSEEQGNKPKFKVAVILPLSEPNPDGLTCSNNFYEDALQNVEALYYALDQIEQDDTLSRNFTLTIEVIENCGQVISELRYLSILAAQLQMEPVYAENAIVGVIYTNYLTKLKYDAIFKSFPRFPRISYLGPPKRISDDREIEEDFFSGSIMLTSGHVFIADVMFEILKQFNWKYIAIYYDTCKFSEMLYFFNDRARTLAIRNKVCVSSLEYCPGHKYSHEEQLHLESTYKTVDVIICFCEKEDLQNLKNLLRTFRKEYIVIAGSMDQYWAQNEVNWESDLGELYYVTPTPQFHEKFYDYYTTLSINSPTKHTYLKEFREQYFEAKFDSKMEYIETSANVYYKDIYMYKNDSKATVNLIKSLHTMSHVFNAVDIKSPWYRMWTTATIAKPKFMFLNEELRFSASFGLPEGEKFDIHKFKAIGNHSSSFFKIGEYETIFIWRFEDQIRIRGKININGTDFEYSEDYPKQTCSKKCSAGNFKVSITSILIGIEIVICWFAVKFHDPDPDIRGSELVLRRFYLDSVFFIKIFAFIALLILFCTYYAFKTRNLPENFNETKCIGFAMYATVLTAVAFSMVYFATDTSNKILAMNLCASINTLTILIFLFAPKLYIILWKPERNTRVYFSPVTSNIRSYIGNESRPNACKPLNQCYSLETSGPQSSSTDAVESVKENERNVFEKVIKEIDIQQIELNLDALKEKVKTGDLQLDEMIDDLQKAYFEKTEKVKLKYNVNVNRVEKNEVK